MSTRAGKKADRQEFHARSGVSTEVEVQDRLLRVTDF